MLPGRKLERANKMLEHWPVFIEKFCEVEFLCYYGQPNWLGWSVIAFGGFILVVIMLTAFFYVFYSPE